MQCFLVVFVFVSLLKLIFCFGLIWCVNFLFCFVFYSMLNKRLRRLLNAPAAHLYGACGASKNTRGISEYIS